MMQTSNNFYIAFILLLVALAIVMWLYVKSKRKRLALAKLEEIVSELEERRAQEEQHRAIDPASDPRFGGDR